MNQPTTLAIVCFLAACGPLPVDAVDETGEDDVATSIFRNNLRRVNLQPQALAQDAAEVRTEDELRAAIGNAVGADGFSFGKTIVIAAGTIVLASTIVLEEPQSGLSFVGRNSTLLTADSSSVFSSVVGGVSGLRFTGLNLSVGLQTGSNSVIDFSAPLVGNQAEFFQCEFGGALRSVHMTAQGSVSMIMSVDLTAVGSSTNSANARFIGNRQSPFSDITITGGSGGNNVISGNAMNGANITTSGSAGENSVLGNTNVGTLTTHATDAVGLNT